jgi:uncharacterized protein (TIGR03437 family)
MSALNGGTAALVLSTLSAGTHFLTAVYSGDANDAPSTSATLTQVVTQAATTTTLGSAANPTASGQSVTLTASVSPSAATGGLTFMDGPSTLGSATLSGGTATLTISNLSIGTHTLTAVYSGDNNFTTSTSATLTKTVNGISPVFPCSPSFSYTIGQPAPASIACQFTAILSASFTVSTTASWLQVNPTSGQLGPSPTSFSLSVNNAGLSPGPYSGSFTISGPQLGSLTVPVQLAVAAGQAGTLLANPSSLSFNYQQGSLAPPTQTLTISSTNGTQLPFTVTPNGGSWLVPVVINATSPTQLNIFVSPIGLAPGSYTGTLTISSAGVLSTVVNVSLNVTAAVPPQLSINSPPLNLAALQGGDPVSAQIQVSNSGGGVLSFSVAASGGAWLSVSPTSGTVDNTASGNASTSSVSLTMTGDPTSLSPGIYEGSVTVTGAGTVTVPVTLSVTAPGPVILVSQAALSFTAVSQGGAPLPQQLGILNVGAGTLNWTATASTFAGGNWLQISSAGGTVQQPYLDVFLANVTIDPTVLSSLAPGDYYGQIQIADAADPATNSPQLVTVILTVESPGSNLGPEISPSSLIFTGQAGVSPAPQSVTVGIRKAVGDQYLSGSIGSGFTYSPASSAVQPDQPATLEVTPDFSRVSPGDIDHGTITLQFSDGTARTISLLTVVAPLESANSRLGARAASNCTNLNVQWREPSPPGFSVVQGQGQTLEVQVVDNCGNLIGPANPKSAAVQATFSNGDADLNLVHVGNGVWTGTWTPVHASKAPNAPLMVNVTAFNSTGLVLQSGQASTLLATLAAGSTPAITGGGVQNAATYLAGVPLAPGSLITLKGSNLADAGSFVAGLPFPSKWNGTQVLMGGQPLLLQDGNASQIDAQVPFDTPINTPFQIVIQHDNMLSVPQQVVISATAPGIFAVNGIGTGPGIIFHSSGVGVALALPSSCGVPAPYTCAPANAGETVVIYCTGLGAVTPPIPTGAEPPDPPVSAVVNPVSVTIGGQDAPVFSAYVAPGQPGVYQVTATVPAGVSGDAVPVVVTVAGQSSPAQVTMAVQ